MSDLIERMDRRAKTLDADAIIAERVGRSTNTICSDAALLREAADALEAARADAERYRWLRDWATGSLAVRRLDAMSPFGVQVTWMSGQQLDTAIDAAMAAEGRE